MIVRIARVKVGNRQAPYINQDPALKSGVLAFAAHSFNGAPAARGSSRNGWLRNIPSFPLTKRELTQTSFAQLCTHISSDGNRRLLTVYAQHTNSFRFVLWTS
jgi:deferrochelatase/peroxidase EfeB